MRAVVAQQDYEDLLRTMAAMLPDEYQEPSREIRPVSMGSATLKYDEDGRVAWNAVWGTFCDLAMAGGPPHKGSLLQAGTVEDILADPESHRFVVEEICRGTMMVTGMRATASPTPGWVRVECATAGMAGWLLRAIVMENVACRQTGRFLELPAGPGYRTEKEVKNVITVIAKTSHYWTEHMSPHTRRVVANSMAELDTQDRLLEPAVCETFTDVARRELTSVGVRQAILRGTGLSASDLRYQGWVGVQLSDLSIAIWMMRAFVASNVLSRREDLTVFVPVNAKQDPDGERVARTVTRVWSFAVQRRGPCEHSATA